MIFLISSTTNAMYVATKKKQMVLYIATAVQRWTEVRKMSEKKWELLKAFLKENGIGYELEPVSIFKGVTQCEIVLPLVVFGGAEDG